MRFVFTLLLLACTTSIQAQSAPDTLIYDGLVVVPAFTIEAGSRDSEGGPGPSMPTFGFRETYLLPYDGRKPFRFLPVVRQGVYSWAGRSRFFFRSAYDTFLRGTQADSMLRRYPDLQTHLPLNLISHADIHFHEAQQLDFPMSPYWRKGLHDPHFWILRVSFRYIAAGNAAVTVPNFTYRPDKDSHLQRWTTTSAPVFLITEILKVEPPYPEK